MKNAVLCLAVLVTLSSDACGQRERNRQLPEGVVDHRDIDYVGDGHERHTLDLFLPPGEAESTRPLVIWIHGGAWLGGDKNNCPALFLLRDGYAVASINYRLSQHATFPAQSHDCKSAIRWLRAHAEEYQLDADHFGVWGASAGGHLVALMGTAGDVEELEGDLGTTDVSSRVQAVCDFFGPSDFPNIAAHCTEISRLDHAAADSPEAKLIGGAISEMPDEAIAVSPITYVTDDDPPFLIVHGDADPIVPFLQSQVLHDALVAAEVESELITIEGGGHGGFGQDDPRDEVREFFNEHLKPSDE